jgi:hypothetical protein
MQTLQSGHKSPSLSTRCSVAAGTTPRQSAGRLPELRRPSSHQPSGYIPPSGNSSRCASLTRPAGARPFAWPDMDSDDEEEQMFAEIFEEEMAAAAQDEEHMLHSLITRCRHRGLRSSLFVRRFETPLCINYCRMIWWSIYGDLFPFNLFENLSNYLLVLLNCMKFAEL